MASYVPPKKNAAFVFYISLEDKANPGLFKASPTLAAGDVLVSTDDGAPANIATLPVVDADFTKRIKVSLSAGEMNGDNVSVIFSDAAGAEWYDLVVNIQTTARQIDDLLAPTTAGRTLDVSVGGEAGIDWSNVGSPTSTVGLSGTTIKSSTDTETAIGDVPTAAEIVAAIDADPPAVNVTMWQGVAVAAADADGNVPVVLYPTQGAVTFGQVKILADVANEGALHVVNSHADGHGQRNSGGITGQYNDGGNVGQYSAGGYAGQYSYGGDVGQRNSGGITGQYNDGGDVGQRNSGGITGQYNDGGNVGQYSAGGYAGQYSYGGDVGQYNEGDNTGQENVGSTPVVGAASQEIADALKRAPAAGTPAAGSVYDLLGDAALEATAQAILSAAGDPWATELPGAYGAGTAGALLSGIDGNVDLLLAADTSTTDATAAGAISRRRGNSWAIPLTIGAITGYTSLWFTIKSSYDDVDTAALVQIKLNSPSASDGLLYVNGTTASSAALGSITVSDATTGAIVVNVDETITDDLAPGEYCYDVQTLIAGDVATPDSGTFTVTADVTRSVT